MPETTIESKPSNEITRIEIDPIIIDDPTKCDVANTTNEEVDDGKEAAKIFHESQSTSNEIDFAKPLSKSSAFSRSAATVIGLETVIDSDDENDSDQDRPNLNCTSTDCTHPDRHDHEVDIESGQPARQRFVTSSSAADLSTLRAAKSASSCSQAAISETHRVEVRRSKSKVRTYLKRCKEALTGGGTQSQPSNANEDSSTCPTALCEKQRRCSTIVVATSSSLWYLENETEDRRKSNDPEVATTTSDTTQPTPIDDSDIVDLATIEIRAKPAVLVAIRSASSDDIATSDPVSSGLCGGGCESDDRLSQLSSDTVIYQPNGSNDSNDKLDGIEGEKEVSENYIIVQCFLNYKMYVGQHLKSPADMNK